MSTPSVSGLTALLDRVMPQVAVRARGSGNGPYRVDEYRQTLVAARNSIDLMAHVNALRFEPSVEAEGLRQELTSFVELALALYIEEGMIQVALLEVIGGGSSGQHVDDIVAKLVELAILHGNERAAAIFCSAVNDPMVAFRRCVMLEGITVDHQTAIYNGVKLEPLPPARSGRTPPLHLLPTGTDSSSEDQFCDAVLLIEDWNSQPRFAKPSVYLARQGSHEVFQSQPEREGFSGFDHEDFARAMSLAVRRHVHASMFWTYVSPDEITNQHSRGVNSCSWRSGWWPRSTPTKVTEDHISNAKDLCRRIVLLDAKQRDKLIVPINRIVKSFDERNYVDRTIDLGIALECLFLDGIRDELRFRLAVRAARFLADDLSQRQGIFNVIKDFYDMRSKAVHTGLTATDDTTKCLLDQTTELCRQAVMKILAHGQPDWDLIDIG